MAVELPGIRIEDLEITFQDGLLTIQGERHPCRTRLPNLVQGGLAGGIIAE